MINKEDDVFSAVSSAVHSYNKNIYCIGTDITSTPPKFPAVSVVQTDNAIQTKFSTFENRENVAKEDYKVEVYSNLSSTKAAQEQAKTITEIVSDTLCNLGYVRTFCKQIPNNDATIVRRVSRYQKNNVI